MRGCTALITEHPRHAISLAKIRFTTDSSLGAFVHSQRPYLWPLCANARPDGPSVEWRGESRLTQPSAVQAMLLIQLCLHILWSPYIDKKLNRARLRLMLGLKYKICRFNRNWRPHARMHARTHAPLMQPSGCVHALSVLRCEHVPAESVLKRA